MTEAPPENQDLNHRTGLVSRAARRSAGFRLLRRLLAYHSALAIALLMLIMVFPTTIDLLPVGGVNELAEGGEVRVSSVDSSSAAADREIVSTVINATAELDKLGYARQLAITLIGTWLLVLPVSWVQKNMNRADTADHSMDETTLILPGIVAAIVLVVQHSLALAFSLAGIVAGVQFRRALQDTFDALFILVAIGTGIAAGVRALEIAAVLTVFFCYATLYVCCFGDGLEAEFSAQRKADKQHRKAQAQQATTGDDTTSSDREGS